MDWNKYLYGLNNPSRYKDPTGHVACEGDNWDDGPKCLKNPNSTLSIIVANEAYRNKVRKHIVDSIRNFDLGDGTIEIDAGINGFASGLGLRGNLSLAFDFKGNLALLRTGGAGGYIGAGGGAGLGLTITNAPSVDYLEGNDVEIGGQVGNVDTVAAEKVVFRGKDRERYSGLSISDQAEILPPWSFEGHATVTNTQVVAQTNIPNLIANFLYWIL